MDEINKQLVISKPCNYFIDACEIYGPQKLHDIIALWGSFLVSIRDLLSDITKNEFESMIVDHVIGAANVD